MSGERGNSTKEVAAYLGVSVKTIRRRMKDSGIPHYYIGNRPRFDKMQVDRWKEKRSIKS